ncbi:MAG: Phospho-N-acetylmuramoyl-pentapeptide-transferase [candidate division WS6 bacterium GW2011_GWE1_34_7]|uniref:Phospho-N-acetylmuramoyl-pentapeptide-transferase n=1 Tax=candidate division WS6 bacterium GW2011_GWE1_34_7 TaxID=1619093 RepID=A0A0G0BP70_9BACT|nr:MAG: Phospho-N-acetylmuramoyl-pentapeptide-transferase [candidate division WS6 bacterium GW2011_GWE1_34_7]
MIDILKESLNYLLVSTVFSIIFAPIMIGLLYRLNQVSGIKKNKLGSREGTNSIFMRIMKSTQTNGTPNMGGILIWIIVPLVTFLFVPMFPQLQVLLIGFMLFGFWGLIDVAIFTNGFKNNEKIKAMQETFEWRLGKLLIATLLNIGVMYLLYKTETFKSINLLNMITLSVTPAILLIASIVGQFAIYSGELTDGLDGLMVGIFTIATASLTVLLLVQGKYDFLPFLTIVLGVLIVDLYFNIPPARFWNGGPGAMPLAFSLFFIGLVTDNLIPYLFMTSVTWVIMGSSAIQILSMKFFHKRVFKIAPIHHHFQAIGWPQYKITMRFWLFTLFLSILGIYLGLL